MKLYIASIGETFRLSGELDSIVNLYNQLKKKKVKVEIITPNDVDLVNFKKDYSYKSGDLVFKTFFDFFKLVRKIRKLKDSVIHIYLNNPSFAFISDLAKTRKNKIIVTFESILPDNSLKELLPGFRKDFFFYFTRVLFLNKLIPRFFSFNADKYVVSTLYQKKQLKKLGVKKNIEVIPNLTDRLKYKNKNKNSCKKKFGFEGEIITYIGHFYHAKGLEYLLEAFLDIVKHYNVRLVLAYSGIGSKDKVNKFIEENKLKDRILMFDKVNVSDLLSASDVFVLPYAYGFSTNLYPNLILEAFSVGVPLVVSDLEPLKELLVNGENVVLSTPRDSDSLGNAIKKILNTSIGNKLVANQRKVIGDSLNPNKLVNQYLKLYENEQKRILFRKRNRK